LGWVADITGLLMLQVGVLQSTVTLVMIRHVESVPNCTVSVVGPVVLRETLVNVTIPAITVVGVPT
jgi:hypothetical protein